MRELSTTRREEPITIDGAAYVVVQASGAAGSIYRNACARAMRMTEADGIKIDGDISNEALLISYCLFKINGDKRDSVPMDTITFWPDGVQRELFDLVKELTPSLDEAPTVEGLEKQIDKLTKLRDRVKGKGKEEAKNSH